MEDGAEKMAALKKVYADIILNTANESAVRVLAAERRAFIFQQSASVTKEEAVGTLLRLKAIMDAKIREAEAVSMGQVRRIQELEAQLNEAEDKITSLQAELKTVNNELDILRSNRAEPFNIQNSNGNLACYTDEYQDNKPNSDPVSSFGSWHMLTFDTAGATTENKCSVENAKQIESMKDLPADFESSGNPDLASIIMVGKEPELYRNGCTQRVRAFVQTLPSSKTDLGSDNDQLLNLKRGSSICENGKDEFCHLNGSGFAGKNLCRGKNLTKSEEIAQHAESSKLSCLVVTRRKRGKRNYIKSTNPGILCVQELTDHGSSDAMSCRKSRDRKSYPNLSFKSENLRLLQCSKKKATRQHAGKQNHSDCENQNLQSPLSSIENDSGESACDPLSTTDMIAGHSTGSVQTDVDDTMQMSLLPKPDQNMKGDSSSALCRETSEATVAPVADSDVKDGKVFESSRNSQGESNKFLKYTFQRKRKRVSLSCGNDNAVLDNKKTVEKQNTLLESQKSSIEMELPRNDRRLVQVARQLISLSEKRW